MSERPRPPLAWAVLGLLGALAVTNLAFLILGRTGGPLVGLVFYLALLAVAWHRRQPDYHPVVIGGLVGLAVHVAEVLLAGWTNYPLLAALNLVLPAVLASVAWLAGREM